MYTSKQITIAIMLAAVTSLVIGGALVASTNTAQAQSKKLTCDTTKDCNIIIRRLKVGDDLIIQFKASPSTGGGGGGTVGTVDQQARDDIANLKTTDAAQDNNIARLETANSELNNQVVALQGENAALKGNLTAVNDAMILQTQAIQELQTAVKNITDANPFVDLNVTGNQSGSGQGEPTPVPPQGNETQGGGENQTTPTPPAGNESSTNPPSNETTTSPPAGNESNTVPVEGNVTVPIEGNVTIPGNITTGPGGETNVTLPIDNSSGNIIVDNGTGTVVENATLANSTNGTITGDVVGFRANN